MSNIGNFIRQKREEANLSLRELGRRCGRSNSAIQRIETGQTKCLDWKLLCKVAKAIGFHPFEILVEAGYIENKDINPCYKLDGLEDLNEDEIKSVQDYINFKLYIRNRLI